CKWIDLGAGEKARLASELKEQFSRTALSHKMNGKKITFQVLSQNDLLSLAG
ncbi:MAG: hypothetical protein HYY44_08920, partial [Deltaproteobacteria bacterium]|nr:hypothetical protein [Deltaproteobacteria bacterium]